MWLCKHLSSNLLTMDNLMAQKFSSLAAVAREHYQKMKVGLALGVGVGVRAGRGDRTTAPMAPLPALPASFHVLVD